MLDTRGNVWRGQHSGAGGDGSALVCKQGEQQSCYSGPSGTAGVGVCKAGVALCKPDGSGFGQCMGEVLPGDEDCSTGDSDEDCDGEAPGVADDKCLCAPGSATNCMTGLLGACAEGHAPCSASGMDYDACEAVHKPSFDDCNNDADEDCDGTKPKCEGKAFAALGFGALGYNSSGWAVAAGPGGVAYVGGDLAGQIWFAKIDTTTNSQVFEKKIPTSFGAADVLAMTVDAAGDLYVAGTFQGTIDLGGGPFSAGAQEDIFVARFDKDLMYIRSEQIGDGSMGLGKQVAYDIAVDAAGDVIVAGGFTGTVDFGNGPLTAGGADAFVARYSADWQLKWLKRAGDPATQVVFGIGLDPSGNVFVGGLNAGVIDFGGGPTQPAGGVDGFLGKLSGADGSQLWLKGFGDGAVGGGSDQVVVNVASDPKGAAVVIGSFKKSAKVGGVDLTNAEPMGATPDVFVAKFDGAGGLAWAQAFGATGTQDASDVTTDGAGNVLMAGQFGSSFSVGDDMLTAAGAGDATGDVFVAKLTGSGEPLWAAGYGNQFNEYSGAIAADSKGNALVTGAFEDILYINVGSGKIQSVGIYDAFLIGLSP